ncbi:MAG: hypothetical protein E6Q27_08900 [Aeromicrobium sp.]|nr:MAG: hypothetical protein E6Q27_08900 [Aeromicrobium sp.]
MCVMKSSLLKHVAGAFAPQHMASLVSDVVGTATAYMRLTVNARANPSVVMSPEYICVPSKASGNIVSAIIAKIAPAATAVIAAITSGVAP